MKRLYELDEVDEPASPSERQSATLETLGLSVPKNVDNPLSNEARANSKNTAELIKFQAEEDERIADWDDAIKEAEENPLFNDDTKEVIIADYKRQRGERRDFIAEAKREAGIE